MKVPEKIRDAITPLNKKVNALIECVEELAKQDEDQIAFNGRTSDIRRDIRERLDALEERPREPSRVTVGFDDRLKALRANMDGANATLIKHNNRLKALEEKLQCTNDSLDCVSEGNEAMCKDISQGVSNLTDRIKALEEKVFPPPNEHQEKPPTCSDCERQGYECGVSDLEPRGDDMTCFVPRKKPPCVECAHLAIDSGPLGGGKCPYNNIKTAQRENRCKHFKPKESKGKKCYACQGEDDILSRTCNYCYECGRRLR